MALLFWISIAILSMCALTKISEWIWPDVTPMPWEEEEADERNRRNAGR